MAYKNKCNPNELFTLKKIFRQKSNLVQTNYDLKSMVEIKKKSKYNP